MTSATLGQLIDRHGVDVLDHLDRQVEVPVLDGLQFQGDLAVIPAGDDTSAFAGSTKQVPEEGLPVIEGVNGGHEHRLLASAPRTASLTTAGTGANGQAIGLLECTEPAYLAHPEHGYLGIAPGAYELRRQREQAAEERIVVD
jgi:hypothetical protein